MSDQRIMFEYSLEFLNNKNLELAHLAQHKDEDNRIAHGGSYKTFAMHDEIVDGMGASWEMCRPCSETEMVHAYCSSNIGNVHSQRLPTVTMYAIYSQLIN